MSDHSEAPTNEEHSPWFTQLWVVLVIIAVVLFIQWGAWCWIEGRYPTGEERAFFGDMFGAVNTLFSGLAFSILAWTMLLQREELKLQRRELQENRTELKRTADSQRDMLKIAKQEQADREAREYRAATLLLSRWKRDGNTLNSDGGFESWRFSATNLGEVVSNVELSMVSMSGVGNYEFDCDLIVPKGGKLDLLIWVEHSNSSKGIENWLSLEFLINYVDGNGRNRQQKYVLNTGEESISCTHLGIDEEEDVFSG